MTVEEVLAKYKKIAVIGLSPDPRRPSYGVTRFMIRNGFDITGVRPGVSEILGRPCYPTLKEVPGPLEIVNVFRRSEHVAQIVDEVLKTDAKVLWLQEEVTDPVAEEKARKAGLTVFSDLCILKEFAQFARRP